MNNTVLLVAMTPLMCQLAQAFGANPVLVAVLMIFALYTAKKLRFQSRSRAFLNVLYKIIIPKGTPTHSKAMMGKLAAKSIPWPMVCLLASVGPMGTALMHSEAGITKMVLGLMKPIFAGQSPMMIYILVCVICCVLTQFMNNTVLLVAMTPFFFFIKL